MAGADGASAQSPRDPEENLLRRLRAIAIIGMLLLVLIAGLVQVSGHPVGDVFFATAGGILLALFGIETIARLPGSR